MSTVYGPLAGQTPTSFAEAKAIEAATGAGVYGKLVADVTPAEVVASLMAQPQEPLVKTTIGTDYTLDELKAAIEADPKLAGELAFAEVARAQGPRKGALRFFVALENLEPEAKSLVEQTLVILDGGE